MQIVLIDDIYLKLEKGRDGRYLDERSFCEDHSSLVTKPLVEVNDAVLSPSKYLTEVVKLSPTNMNLIHSGSKQSLYTAVLNIQLLQEFPASLLSVQTRISVEGRRYEAVYEAERFLNTTFQWDGLNVYGNKHYGYAYVRLGVGYNYKMCHETVWEMMTVKVHGHSPPSSDLGGWNLNIHHTYNKHDGIIYRGDGDVTVAEKSEKMVKVLNEDLSKSIIAPVAIQVHKDNSIIVGDKKFIRHIDEHGKVTNLLKLNETTANHKYYLTVGNLLTIKAGKASFIFMSDPINKRILKIPLNLPSDRTLENNFDVLIGSEETCGYFDDDCLDNPDPLKANLVYPKGLSVTNENELVFIDGSLIKLLTSEERLLTIAGINLAASDWTPSHCGSDTRALETHFKWPTELAVNPINSDIAVIDQDSLYILTKQGRIKEVLGNRNMCPQDRPQISYPPKSLVYSHNGDLIVADEHDIIHKMNANNEFEEVAGSMSFCKRSTFGCLQSDFDEAVTVGSKARFVSISSLSVDWEGTIYVTDTDKHHIRTISVHKPRLDEFSQTYDIISAHHEEIYQFDKDGRHINTRGLYIDTAGGYEFDYGENNRLESVRDKELNKLTLTRNGNMIHFNMTSGLQFHLRNNREDLLEQVTLPDGFMIMFSYDEQGKIRRKLMERKIQIIYNYNKFNQLETVHGAESTGSNHQSSSVKNVKYITEQSELLEELYGYESKFNLLNVGIEHSLNNTSVHRVKWNNFIHSARTRSSFGLNVDGIGKRLEINDEPAFTSELHPRSMIKSLYDNKGIQLLRVEEYGVPKRTIFFPAKNSFNAVDEIFDSRGRLVKWSRGLMNQSISYDDLGRISQKSTCHLQNKFSYLYKESQYPAGRNQYQIELDNNGGLLFVVTPTGGRHQFVFSPRIGEYVLQYLPPWTKEAFYFKIDNNGNLRSRKQSGADEILYFGKSKLVCSNLEIKEVVEAQLFKRKYLDATWKIEEDTYTTEKEVSTRRILLKNNFEIEKVEILCFYTNKNNTIKCRVQMNGFTTSTSTIYEKHTNKIRKSNNFEIIHSGQSYAWVNQKENIIFKYELDGFGKIFRREVSLKNKIIYSKAIEYNCLGQVTKMSESVDNSTPEVKEIKYNKEGLMKQVKGKFNWGFHYDENNNVIEIKYATGTIQFEYEAGERIKEIKGRNSVIEYSESGAMMKKDLYTFEYNCNNQLVRILHGDKIRKEIVYDAIGRPVLILNPVQNTNTSFIYHLQEQRKWEIMLWSSGQDIARPEYDHHGHMIAVETDDLLYPVITDNVKTPYLVFSQDGEVVKRRTYAPFGALIDDSNEEFHLPVGYHGGLELEEAGVVLIEGRAYDSLLGQWMVPDVNSILTFPSNTDVTDLHFYRFKKNDPLNNIDPGYMDSLQDWLTFFNFDLKSLETSILHSHIFKGLNIPSMRQEKSEPMLDPNIQKGFKLENERRDVSIARSFHLSSPLFPNVILSRDNDRISSIPVQGASQVELKMATLINNSIILENYGDDLNTIYFVKQDRFTDEDIESLKKYLRIEERLIPPFGREVCFNTSVKLCGLSGIEAIEVDQLKDNLEMGQIVPDGERRQE